MTSAEIAGAFENLSTPLVADALVRLALPLRVAPREIRAHVGTRVAGRALPACHAGSVDIFLEAFEQADRGDVLVIDNGGRTDEGCIGDLVAIEATTHGIGGIVLWGTHRDSADLQRIGLPVFSCGVCPNGPLRARERELDALARARVGWQLVEGHDVVFADLDGVLFINDGQLPAVLNMASDIAKRERRQAERVRAGQSLRAQLQFQDYLHRRDRDPQYTFRQHLRTIGGAIEE
jgi:regulator of RNase E activity RraA